MEELGKSQINRTSLAGVILLMTFIAFVSLAAGFAWSKRADAATSKHGSKNPKVIYPKQTKIDFEGLSIEGELKNPGEFYFQHRNEEKFDSLVQRRKNFHREMLRDVVMSK